FSPRFRTRARSASNRGGEETLDVDRATRRAARDARTARQRYIHRIPLQGRGERQGRPAPGGTSSTARFASRRSTRTSRTGGGTGRRPSRGFEREGRGRHETLGIAP